MLKIGVLCNKTNYSTKMISKNCLKIPKNNQERTNGQKHHHINFCFNAEMYKQQRIAFILKVGTSGNEQ